MITQPRDNDGTRPVAPAFRHAGGQDEDGTQWRRPHRQFSTTGPDSRTYTMFMVDPEVRIYDDPPRVVTPPDIQWLWDKPSSFTRGTRVRGRIIGAAITGVTFEAWPIVPGDRFALLDPGASPVVRFTLSGIYDEKAKAGRYGITSLTVGPSTAHKEQLASLTRVWVQSGRHEPPHYFVHEEVTKRDLSRLPITTLVDHALAMVRVFGHIDRTYKRPPRQGEWPDDNNGSIRIAFLGFDNDPNAAKVPRRRKRGPTEALHTKAWHDQENLAIAAYCKRQGMTRQETVEYFLAERGDKWSTASVKKMWVKCREDGLLPKIDKNKTDRGRE